MTKKKAQPNSSRPNGAKSIRTLEHQISSLRGQLKSGSTRTSGNQGALSVSRKEFWFSPDPAQGTPVTTAVGSKTFQPGSSGIAQLDQFGQMFELYRVKKAVIHYVSASGSTSSGMVHLGADYDPTDVPTTVSGVTTLQPCMSTTPWKNGSITLSPELINRGNWRYTAAGPSSHMDWGPAFAAVYSNSCVTVPGEFWLDYEIEFRSPASQNQVGVGVYTGRRMIDVESMSTSTNPVFAVSYGGTVSDWYGGTGPPPSLTMTPEWGNASLGSTSFGTRFDFSGLSPGSLYDFTANLGGWPQNLPTLRVDGFVGDLLGAASLAATKFTSPSASYLEGYGLGDMPYIGINGFSNLFQQFRASDTGTLSFSLLAGTAAAMGAGTLSVLLEFCLQSLGMQKVVPHNH